MKSIEIEGKTVEEALNKALLELKTDKHMVDVDVLDQGSKGLFNVIGVKPAKVRVSLKYNYIEEARNFLANILKAMKIDAEINIEEDDDTLHINLNGKNIGLLIGYRGETLDSLQYLTSLVINKNHEDEYIRVSLDTENYRQKREETLIKVAQKTAYKVRKSGRAYKLEPMNPYERRIIHSTLQDYNDINTYSEGEEPFRRVVVSIKR